MKKLVPFALLFVFLFTQACQQSAKTTETTDADLYKKAVTLAQTTIMIDGHVDIPYRLRNHPEDISVATQGGHFDYVRAMKGGLNAPIMSIYIPSEKENNGAKALADTLIGMVEELAANHPDKFAVATSPEQIEAQFANGLISLPMGMENGAPIEGDLANIEYFHSRGIRYITLTHAKDNHICDSSYDTTRTWNGLSEFGEQVVAEMNRVGIMIDISHVSDSAFSQVMALTKVPLIASHSSCRHFTPGLERNMSDAMIKQLAENGGVIHINYGSFFLEDGWSEKKEADSTYSTTVQQVADHIDHAVAVGGIDHVGFGSDFDGVSSLPVGLSDASMMPNLIEELLKRGYTDEDIKKICYKNTFRVWRAVEDYAASRKNS
jgi:membrane dipeptidase